MNRQQIPSATLSCHALLCLLAGVFISLSGCSTLSLGSPGKPIAPGDATGGYTVEMHSSFSGIKGYKGSLDGNTTVSDALMASGATKKYRSMEVEVRRVVKKNGASRGLVMPVRYEPKTRNIPPEQDYALKNGDRVVVKPASGSSVLKVLSSLSGG